MIVCIPTDDKEHISEHFGRAQYFAIADTEAGAQGIKFVENPHNKAESDQSGHGMLLKFLVQNKAQIVFCTELGERMRDNLSSLKIEIKQVPDHSKITELLKQ
ncbi:MAG: NifB/NifX family molybdenum-iron cluster-binding protein [Candidatus Micrarchaeaceae archaeon]